MNCLVTGASGFLGRHITRQLRGAGHKITTLGRQQSETHRSILADIRQPFDIDGEVFDAVFHVAGKAHVVPSTEPERQAFYQVNQLGTQHLLQALDRAGRPPMFFVLISTIAVYGRQDGERLPETTATNPITPYGHSKLAAEELVKEWCSRWNCRWTILRLPLVAGQGAPGNLQAMVQALAKHRYVGIGGGDARRSMVRAQDVANSLPRIMEVGGLYHLTDGHHPSLKELELAICTSLKRRPPPRIPNVVAKIAGWSGDFADRFASIRLPIDSDRVAKLTNTYTVSDDAIRQQIHWNPERVIDHVGELHAS